MSTRFKTEAEKNFGVPPLPSGYGESMPQGSLTIPPCGVEDVDVAVFNLFDKEINLQVMSNVTDVIKVPVVFAAGEKWAMLKNNRPLRDRNNTLILPLITVMRTDVSQNASEDIVGRGINQQVGELVIKRRLNSNDRSYQSLINRLLIPNQDNLMMADGTATGDQPTTARDVGSLALTSEGFNGALLKQDRLNNVYETIVVPTPQFYTAKYQVTIWTQYTQHANQIVEKLFSSLLPQGQSWKLSTTKGYWFIARFDDGSLSTETNFEDIAQQERFIKHTFTMSVPAYFFATKSPGSPIPVRRYVSSPVVKFESIEPFETGYDYKEESQYVIGSDDPTLPLEDRRNLRRDQRNIGFSNSKLYPAVPDDGRVVSREDAIRANDPAMKNAKKWRNNSTRKNLKGETVYSSKSGTTLEVIIANLSKK